VLDYGGNHLRKDFTQHKHIGPTLQNVQEVETVKDVAQNVPKSYAIVHNFQVDHHVAIIEMKGMLRDQSISVLINPSSNFSYISPIVVERCALKKEAHHES